MVNCSRARGDVFPSKVSLWMVWRRGNDSSPSGKMRVHNDEYDFGQRLCECLCDQERTTDSVSGGETRDMEHDLCACAAVFWGAICDPPSGCVELFCGATCDHSAGCLEQARGIMFCDVDRQMCECPGDRKSVNRDMSCEIADDMELVSCACVTMYCVTIYTSISGSFDHVCARATGAFDLPCSRQSRSCLLSSSED
eukprot:2184978-Amphidinium_carterae.1